MPDHLREAIKGNYPEAASNPSVLDQFTWNLIIENGSVKIPVVLVSFCEIGTESLHAARLSRQGPGHLRTLLTVDPHGHLHTPRNGHEGILKRLAKAEHRIEVEEADLQDITNLFQALTMEHERILVRSVISHEIGVINANVSSRMSPLAPTAPFLRGHALRTLRTSCQTSLNPVFLPAARLPVITILPLPALPLAPIRNSISIQSHHNRRFASEVIRDYHLHTSSYILLVSSTLHLRSIKSCLVISTHPYIGIAFFIITLSPRSPFLVVSSPLCL